MTVPFGDTILKILFKNLLKPVRELVSVSRQFNNECTLHYRYCKKFYDPEIFTVKNVFTNVQSQPK